MTPSIPSLKQAGLDFIKPLENTPTTVGVYSFNRAGATKIGPTSIKQAGGATAVKNAINSISATTTKYQKGTNWQGGLSQVPSGAYDVVYFITDGFPTTDNQTTGQDPYYVPHLNDINYAIEAANNLKNAGTRVVPIYVQNLTPDAGTPWYNYMLTNGVYFVNNNVVTTGGVASSRVKADKNPATSIWEAGTSYAKYNNAVQGIDSTVIKYFADEDDYGLAFYSQAVAGNMSISETLASISGPGSSIQLQNISQLSPELVKIATATCSGKLTVNKQIVDESGKVVAATGAEVTGWVFAAGNAQSPIFLKDGTQTVPTVTRTSDNNGVAMYQFGSSTSTGSGSLTIAETQMPGFSLYQQAGRNAVCTDKAGASVPVANDGADGFKLTVAADNSYNCVVQNVKKPEAKVGPSPVWWTR